MMTTVMILTVVESMVCQDVHDDNKIEKGLREGDVR